MTAVAIALLIWVVGIPTGALCLAAVCRWRAARTPSPLPPYRPVELSLRLPARRPCEGRRRIQPAERAARRARNLA